MASKIYEIAFSVAGKLQSDFAKTFSKANSSVDGFNDKLNNLNKQAAQTGKLVKMKTEVAEASRAYNQARQNVAKLGQAISKTSNPTKQQIAEFKQAENVVSKAKATLDKKRASLKEYEDSVDSSGESMKTLIARQKELSEQADNARKALEKQQKINEKIEKASAIQEKSKSVRSVGNTQLMAAGGAAVGAGAYMVKMGTEYTSALNKMQAQTGATNAEMKQLSESARNIYKSGMGESFEHVTASMANFQQVSGLSGKELEKATSNAMMLSDTFDMDVNESARAASAMAKNLGISYDKAFGLIAYGAQNGANKNGDLLDTFNEYSVHYKAMGFSADQFTQHLVEGAKSGAFSIDKIGDAMKEFNIRSKDGSKNSLEAFEALGINGELATKKFAAGGETAREAFFAVVEALDGIEDPVKKNAIGVQLFGTQFEDLEAGALKTFSKIQNASVDSEGTLKKINAVRYNDLGSQLTILSRKFSDTLTPAGEGMAKALSGKMPQIEAAFAKVQPIISNLATSIANAMPSIIDAVGSVISKVASFTQTIANNWSWIGPIVMGVVKTFLGLKVIAYLISPLMTLYKGFMMLKNGITLLRNSTLLSTIATKANAAAQWLMNTAFLGCPVAWLVAGIAAIIAIGVLLYKNWDKVKAGAVALWKGITNAFQGIRDKVASVFGSLVGIVKGPINSVIGLVNKAIGAINGINVKVPDWVPGFGGKSFGVNIPKIPKLAQGGIATAPTLAMIGEGRENEAVLPLSKLDAMLGGQSSGGGSMTVNFAPVITINGGGADVTAQVRQGLDEGLKNLKRELERLKLNDRRLSYV